MDCKPVYCVDARGVGAWAIVSIAFEECIDGEYGGWEFYSYGWADSDAGWLAYRHKRTGGTAMTDKQLKSMTIADLVKLAELLNMDVHFVIGNRPGRCEGGKRE